MEVVEYHTVTVIRFHHKLFLKLIIRHFYNDGRMSSITELNQNRPLLVRAKLVAKTKATPHSKSSYKNVTLYCFLS